MLAFSTSAAAKESGDFQLGGSLHWMFHNDTTNNLGFTIHVAGTHVAKTANWLNIGAQSDWGVTKNDTLSLRFRAGVLRLQDSSQTPGYLLTYLVARIRAGKWILSTKAGFARGDSKEAFLGLGVDYYLKQWVYIGSEVAKTPIWSDYSQLHLGFRAYGQEAGIWHRNYFNKDHHWGVFINIQFASRK